MSTYPIILTTDVSTPIATSYTFKQEDYGIPLEITVQNYDATGKTARIVFRKPDTNFVEYTINPVNGVFIHTLTGMETQAPGIVVADMKFYKDGVRESTSSFIFTVEKDTYNQAVMSGAYSDSLKVAIEEATERAIAAAKACEDLVAGVLPIANNQSTNVAGYCLDARQANPSIPGTLGEKVEQNKQSIATLNNNLDLFGLKPRGDVQHIVDIKNIGLYSITNASEMPSGNPYTILSLGKQGREWNYSIIAFDSYGNGTYRGKLGTANGSTYVFNSWSQIC